MASDLYSNRIICLYGSTFKERSINNTYNYGLMNREEILTLHAWIYAYGWLKKKGQHFWQELKGHLMPQVTADFVKQRWCAGVAPLKMPYFTVKTTNLSIHLEQYLCPPIINQIHTVLNEPWTVLRMGQIGHDNTPAWAGPRWFFWKGLEEWPGLKGILTKTIF